LKGFFKNGTTEIQARIDVVAQKLFDDQAAYATLPPAL